MSQPNEVNTECEADNATYFGPSYVSEKDIDVKLYNFCKQSFPSFSKRKLRECFKNGYVVVNDIPIRAGHIDEMRRLLLSDKVEIFLNTMALERMKLDGIKLDIRYQSTGLVIINKLSGVSVAPDKEYEKALKILLWNGEHRDSCKLLYHLEKSLNGLCIVAQTMPHYKRIREMMVSGSSLTASAIINDESVTANNTLPQIALTYRAVVCGFIGEAGSTVDIPTTYYDMPVLSVQVISTSRCRSCNYLSLIDISPLMFGALRMGTADRSEYTLTNDPSVSHIRDKYQMYTESFLDTLERPVTGADYKVLHYPTKYVKSVKRAMMRAGHAVVGDGDMVKKSKGIHAALVAIRISAPVDNTGADDTTVYPVVIEVSTPDKFAKLLLREERMWHLANDRDQDKLQEHKERQNTGGRRGNKNKKTKATVGDIVEELTRTHIATATPHTGDSSDEENESGEDNSQCDEDSSSGSDSESDHASSALTTSVEEGEDHDLPVEYRIGEATFCGSVFNVSPHVMIPRKSSEALVNEAVRLLSGNESGARVLDLGTGSGCLLLSCMALLNKQTSEQTVSGVGVDISCDALDVARSNADKLSLSDTALFAEGSFDDLLSALQSVGGDRPFDLILCNPPYSSKKDRTRLSVSRRSHEPSIALYAPRSVSINNNGESSSVLQGGTMGAYHMIARSIRVVHTYQRGLKDSSGQGGVLLRDGAHLVVEMGHGQERQVRAIFDAAKCLQFMHTIRDHLDIVRCVVYKYCLHDIVETNNV